MQMTRQHPSLETIAALAEGRVAGEDQSHLVEHLSGCRECYALFAAAAAFVEEGQAPVEAVPEEKFRWWPILAAAAVLVLIVGSLSWFLPSEDPMDKLVEAANQLPYRVTEGRLSQDFEWRTMTSVSRAGGLNQDPQWMRLQGAAAGVLESKPDVSDQDVALAHLLAGNHQLAAEMLSTIVAQDPRNAGAWSDLAAALLAKGSRSRDGENAARALEAAETSLGIDESLPEARFNQALALEALGRRAAAREAWLEYLRLDSTSGWAKEASARAESQ
jgi:tetratricopeptide (TPR) repeat protein